MAKKSNTPHPITIAPGEKLTPEKQAMQNAWDAYNNPNQGQPQMGGYPVGPNGGMLVNQGLLGYSPGYFNNPQNLAQTYETYAGQDVKPDWLDWGAVEAGYKYYQATQGADPKRWMWLTAEDPAATFLAGLGNPPAQGQAPVQPYNPAAAPTEPMSGGTLDIQTMPVQQRTALYSAPTFDIMQYDPATREAILGDTAFPWETLPDWQKTYYKLISNPAVMSLPVGLAGATSGAAVGAVFGLGLPGAIAGGLGGFLLGMIGGQEYDPTLPYDEQPTPAAKAMYILNRASEATEQYIGAASQLSYEGGKMPYQVSAEEKAAKTDFNMAFLTDKKAREATLEAGRIFYEYADTPLKNLAPIVFSFAEVFKPENWDKEIKPTGVPLLGQGEDWIIGSADPQKKQAATQAMQQLRLGILDAYEQGASVEDVRALIRSAMGEAGQFVGGQLDDLVLQSVLDPLNMLPEVAGMARGKIVSTFGDNFTANKAMLAGLSREGGVLGIGSIPKYRDLVQSGAFGMVDELGAIDRLVGGIDKDGRIKSLASDKPANLADYLRNMTPESKARTAVYTMSDNLKAMLFDASPADFIKRFTVAASGDLKAARDMGAAYLGSPEAYTFLPILKDFTKSAQGLFNSWQAGEQPRAALLNAGKLLGENPGEFLRGMLDGDPAPDFARLVDAANKAGDDPGARAFLEGIQRGEITAESMARDFEIFKSIPYHPDEWKAMVYDSFMEHVGKRVADIYKLDPGSKFMQSVATLKGVQSLLLLSLSPSYLINNVANNAVTMAADGLFGMLPPWKVDQWLDKFGLAPTRISQGIGAIGDTTRIDTGYGKAGDGVFKSPEFKSPEEILGKATQAQGLNGRARDVLRAVNNKVGVMGKASAAMERAQSKQATVTAMRKFWSNVWQRGKGFERMPALLETSMRQAGIDPEIVYTAIEAGMNWQDVDGMLRGNAQLGARYQVANYVNRAADKLGKKPEDVRNVLASAGVLEDLESNLTRATSEVDIQRAFIAADKKAQRWIDTVSAQELRANAEAVTQQTKTEGLAGVHNLFTEMYSRLDKRYFDNRVAWEDAFQMADVSLDQSTRSAIMNAQREASISEWRRFFEYEAAAYKGVLDGLGMDNERHRKFMAGLADYQKQNADFYRKQADMWREFSNTIFENKEQRRAAFRGLQDDLDMLYRDMTIEKNKIWMVLDDELAGWFGQKYGPEGEKLARKWLKDKANAHDVLAQAVRQHREMVKDFPYEAKRAEWQRFVNEEYLPLARKLTEAGSNGAAEMYAGITGRPGGPADMGPAGQVEAKPVPKTEELFAPENVARTQEINQAADAHAANVWQVAAKYGIFGVDDAGLTKPSAKLDMMKTVKKWGGSDAAGVRTFSDLTPSVVEKALANRSEWERMQAEFDAAVVEKQVEVAQEAQPQATETATTAPENIPNIPEPIQTVEPPAPIDPKVKKRQDTLDYIQRTTLDKLPEPVRNAMLRALKAMEDQATAEHGDSLFQWLRSRGGINMRYISDLTGEGKPRREWGPGLFTNKTGTENSLDIIAREAVDYGYLTPDVLDNPNDTGGVNAFTEAFQRELAGDKVYQAGKEALPEWYKTIKAGADKKATVLAAIDRVRSGTDAVKYGGKPTATELAVKENAFNLLADEAVYDSKLAELTGFDFDDGGIADDLAALEARVDYNDLAGLIERQDEVMALLSEMTEESAVNKALDLNTRINDAIRILEEKAAAEQVITQAETRAETEMTRRAWHEAQIETMGMTPEKADAFLAVMDGVAEYWARHMGRSVDEFWAEHVREFNRGGEASLNQNGLPMDKNLIVAHNLSESKLLFADDLGGLAMPSLAITKKDIPFEGFGNITLLGDKRLIDPGDRTNVVADADIYTPRYPRAEYIPNGAEIKSFIDSVKDQYAAKYGELTDYNHKADGFAEDFRIDGARALENNTLVMAAYAIEKGIELPETERGLRDIRSEPGYSDFVNDLAGRFAQDKRFFKGFTNSGNRRYATYTLDNVIAEMKANMKEGEGFNYGAGSVRAKGANKFKTIEQIRNAQGRLVPDIGELKDYFNNRMNELADANAGTYKYKADSFGYYQAFADALADGLQKKNVRRTLIEYGWTEPDMGPITQFLDELTSAPTEYFEAKIQRGVGLGEFKVAIIPNDIGAKARSVLEDRGLRLFEYDADKKGSRQAAIEAATTANPDLLFQTAYHGSPYKFDKFSLEHMGSGEGAQAYGWGLYFADDKSVADWYRESLTGRKFGSPNNVTYKGMNVEQLDAAAFTNSDPALSAASSVAYDLQYGVPFSESISSRMDQYRRDYEYRLKEMTDNGNEMYADFLKTAAEKQKAKLDALSSFKESDFSITENTGQLYAVDIPDENYLLWDKPLSEQPEAVRQALEGLGIKPVKEEIQWRENQGLRKIDSFRPRNGNEIWIEPDDGKFYVVEERPDGSKYHGSFDTKEAAKREAERLFAYTWNGNVSGEDIYHSIATNPKAASLALRDAGISGIKYLDGSSRSKGEGNYNYVIFDDNAVKILETYYQGAKGGITFDDMGRAAITAFEGADFSTVVHEHAHIFLPMLERMVSEGAGELVRADLNAVHNWMTDEAARLNAERKAGNLSGAQLSALFMDDAGNPTDILTPFREDGSYSRAGMELFARGFERYVTEGIAPTPKLVKVFESFKRWMLNIYGQITGSSVDVRINDRVRQVFDNLVSGDNLRITTQNNAARKIWFDNQRGVPDTYGGGNNYATYYDETGRSVGVIRWDDKGVYAYVPAAMNLTESINKLITVVANSLEMEPDKVWQMLADSKVVEEKPPKYKFDVKLDEAKRAADVADVVGTDFFAKLAEMKAQPETPAIDQGATGGSIADRLGHPDISIKTSRSKNSGTVTFTNAPSAELVGLLEKYGLQKTDLIGLEWEGTQAQALMFDDAYRAVPVVKTENPYSPTVPMTPGQGSQFMESAQPADTGMAGGLLPGMQESTGMMFDVQNTGKMRKMEAPQAKSVFDVKPGKTTIDTTGATVKAGDIVTGKDGTRYGVKGVNAQGKIVTQDGKLVSPADVKLAGSQDMMFQKTPTLDELEKAIKERHNLKTFILYESSGNIVLDMIEVEKGNRKQGAGTAALKDLIRYADENGKRIILTPGQKDDLHGTTSRGRLVEFYKRFGFVENKGRNKDFSFREGMYREPMMFQQAPPTESKAFRDWFGDSKVVDENGQPLVVYHGTKADFDAFNTGKPKKNMQLGFGIHFTPDAGFTDSYSMSVSSSGERSPIAGGKVYPAYLSIQKLLDADAIYKPGSPEYALAEKLAKGTKIGLYKDGIYLQTIIDAVNPQKAERIIREAGYDGVKYNAQNVSGWRYSGGRAMPIIGEEAISYLVFEPTQIKSTFNRGTFDPDNPNILYQNTPDNPVLPPGGYEDMTGYLNQSRVQDEAWAEQVRPILSAMQSAAQESGGMPELNIPPDQAQSFGRYMQRVKNQMTTAKRSTAKYGEASRDFAMLNYNKQYGWDKWAQVLFPYEFWTTRSMMNWAIRAMDRPAMLANYARLKRFQNQYQTNEPERLRDKMWVPMPFLPEWAGGGLYVNPNPMLFPFENFLSPLKQYATSKGYEANNATYQVQRWADEGKVSQADAQQAIQSQSGAVWERAIKAAQAEGGDNPMDYFSMLFGPALYATLPYYLATGKKLGSGAYPSSPLPITRTGKALETAFKGTGLEWLGNTVGGALQYPENKLREIKGLSEFGEWGDFYIDRQLANMAAEGKYTADQVRQAMIERSGTIYDEAVERVNVEYLAKTPGMLPLYGAAHGAQLDQVLGSLLPSMFSGGLLPEGELELKGLKGEYNLAWEKYKSGDKEALTTFFDTYPEYEARLALRDDPDERLRNFLASQIWDNYNAIGKTYRKQAGMALGDEFGEWLSNSTELTDSIPVEKLARWAQVLGGMVPKTPETQPVLDQPQAINWYDQKTQGILDQFYQERDEKFPNYWFIQSGYYSQPPSKRAAYLIQFPELKQYWDWKDGWNQKYPEMKPYFSGEVFKQLDTSTWPDPLVYQVMLYAMSGQRLTGGAESYLEAIWSGMGRPYGSLWSWINADVAPAMRTRVTGAGSQLYPVGP